MGTKNRQRRAAKVKARERQGRGRAGWSPPGGPPPPSGLSRSGPAPGGERQRVEALYALNQLARGRADAAEVASTVAELARCSPATVAREVEADLARILPALWAGGWLPGEVIRQARRATSATGEHLAALAVATDHLRRPQSALHPRWAAHVDQLDLPPGAGAGWLRREHASLQPGPAPAEWATLIDLASEVAFALTRLRRLTEIIPPPGSPRAEASIVDLASRAAVDRILAKVRQLLAQAESTNFDAEAEAFTAKAQELMSRHAIDAALVWDRDRHDHPVTIRVPIDDPYAEAKSLLITVVADESHCRAVIDTNHGLASVIGFETDLVWCETLYTSLLIQAQREMSRAGRDDLAGGRRRSRSFRTSFLFAYATRIGERLAEVNAHVRRTVDAEAPPATESATESATEPGDRTAGGALVPILARRRSAVDDEVDARFGTLAPGSVRSGNDRLGWNAGRQAADRAELAQGRLDFASA